MEKNIIKIIQMAYPVILIILGILNIVCKIPYGVQIAQGIFLVVLPIVLIIYKIKEKLFK
jgi:hypothetical protein